MTKRTSITFGVADGADTLQLVLSLSEAATGLDFTAITHTVAAATWDAIALGSVAAPDLLMLKNNGATNYIELAVDSAGTYKFAKLTPGRAIFLPCAGSTTYYAKAHTADVEVKILAAVA